MPEYILNLLIQVPLVVAFMWFTLRLSADYRADAALRANQWQAFIDKQNELWRNFIKDLNEQNCTSNDLTAQRLGELAKVIEGLQSDFRVHDQRTETRVRQ